MRERIEACIAKLRAGTLAEADLRGLLDSSAPGSAASPAPATSPRQQLLYLQLQNTHPASQALGYTLIVNGATVDAPTDPNQWPYQSALHALRDGWRIISFPDLALLMDPVIPRGLGCEFILEKWS
ncbi:MAG: hypothetical protein NTW19_02325 [Planctomycetota bacterium]|nr:hypothetical protein [Planctomycetota bacterium]